ncbi:hypothetical protein KKI24_08875 [bacterium]|nr:hypothetical protein [bacterium]
MLIKRMIIFIILSLFFSSCSCDKKEIEAVNQRIQSLEKQIQTEEKTKIELTKRSKNIDQLSEIMRNGENEMAALQRQEKLLDSQVLNMNTELNELENQAETLQNELSILKVNVDGYAKQRLD